MAISFDGTGYGTDGTIWGGEVLLAGYHDFERAAHLATLPLAGGDAAVKRPYRLALAHLWAADLPWNERLAPVAACRAAERERLTPPAETDLNTVPTSSMGRLFDAVAALAGVRQTITYEAQAAVELEALTAPDLREAYRFTLDEGVFDAAPVLEGVAADVLAGVDPARIAARFHNAVAGLIVEISVAYRQETGINKVALSGGVFQNVTLLEAAVGRLAQADFETLVHHKVPPNDGGLALGQAVIAAAQQRGQP